MTDITPVVTSIADDGFAAVAASAASKSILIGQLVRFRKGHFPVGRDEGDLLGATLVAHGVTRLWQKWHEGTVIEQIPYVRGQFFPEEVDEIEDDGEPGEWALSSLLYLRDLDTGADFTFVTPSASGRRSVGQLSRQITNQRMMFPTVMPVVRLTAAKFRSRHFGEIDKPEFVVIGWVAPDGERLDTKPGPKVVSTAKELIDDEIPF
jgi:hypothetical protein